MAQISIRTLLELTAAVAVVLAFIFLRQGESPPPPAATPPNAGRYQLVTEPGRDRLLLFDPETGACWERYSSGQWSPYTAGLKQATKP